jgi:beta-glucosidase
VTFDRGVVVPAAHLDRARAVEDLALLHETGASVVRIGLDWPWMQPAAGAVNGDAVELYTAIANAASSMGLTLQFTILDREVPTWFDNDGGFGDARFAGHWWPRWVELCADTFGDLVGGWVPIEHPLSVANRLFPNDPRRHGDVLDTLVTAWRDAWRLLRGGPPVVTSFGLEIVRPVDQTIPAEQAAKRWDQIRFGLWLEGLANGRAVIPGRADREVADLAGACDVLGVVVRHEHDTLGLLHRAAEQGPADTPMAVTLLLPPGKDADREVAVERYLHEVTEAASGLDLRTASVNPAFDLPGDERGVFTRDRDAKDSARMFFGAT